MRCRLLMPLLWSLGCCCSSAALLLPARPASATCSPNQYFLPPDSIGGFRNPRCIAIGDFNGDGIRDLVVASPAVYSYGGLGGRIGILIGNGTGGVGDGSFQPEVPYLAGLAPFTPAIGDYNSDGIQDLAVSNWLSNDVTILFGLGSGGIGNGTFGPPHSYGAGSAPFLVLTGDFNGDKILDLAVSNNGEAAVSVLLGHGSSGHGDGTFAPRVAYPLLNLSTGLASGDFNEDGITDLVATENYNHTVAVLMGNGSGGVGSGTFAPAVHYPGGLEPYSIHPGDFDYDGITDLMVTNGSSDGVRFLKGQGTLGQGDGTFAPSASVIGGNDPGVISGDFNLDGSLDLLVTTADPNIGPGQGTVRVLIGHGNATYTPSPITYSVGHDPLVPVSADFNGDGLADVALPNYYDSTISILFGGCFMATAAQVSVADLSVTPEGVSIQWLLGQGAGAAVNIYRRSGNDGWAALGVQFADGTGRVRYEDRSVVPSCHYTYRIGIGVGSSEEFGGETAVTVPGLALALERVRPNPTRTGPFNLAFSLTSGHAADLTIMDTAGRRIFSRSVGALGAGRHTLALDTGDLVRSGLYVLRLTQDGRTVSTKMTVVH
jgi:FG-GAP-like repeat